MVLHSIRVDHEQEERWYPHPWSHGKSLSYLSCCKMTSDSRLCMALMLRSKAGVLSFLPPLKILRVVMWSCGYVAETETVTLRINCKAATCNKGTLNVNETGTNPRAVVYSFWKYGNCKSVPKLVQVVQASRLGCKTQVHTSTLNVLPQQSRKSFRVCFNDMHGIQRCSKMSYSKTPDATPCNTMQYDGIAEGLR